MQMHFVVVFNGSTCRNKTHAHAVHVALPCQSSSSRRCCRPKSLRQPSLPSRVPGLQQGPRALRRFGAGLRRSLAPCLRLAVIWKMTRVRRGCFSFLLLSVQMNWAVESLSASQTCTGDMGRSQGRVSDALRLAANHCLGLLSLLLQCVAPMVT